MSCLKKEGDKGSHSIPNVSVTAGIFLKEGFLWEVARRRIAMPLVLPQYPSNKIAFCFVLQTAVQLSI